MLALAADRAADAASEGRAPSGPYGATAGGWEHTTIDDYLDAAVASARANTTMGEQPSWREFARFLVLGKYYE